MNPSVCFHDQLASRWEKKYQKRSFQVREAILASCLSGRSLTDSRWLDAGCGSGRLTRWLARQGCVTFGVDAAPSMVRLARELARDDPCAGRQTFAEVDTIEKLGFPDASFDGVLCSSVLEYLEEPGKALAELGRVLRPGGILLVSVPNKSSLVRKSLRAAFRLSRALLGRPWPRYLGYSRNEYSAADFSRLLEEHGLSPQSKYWFGGARWAWLYRQPGIGTLIMFAACKDAQGATLGTTCPSG